MNSPFSWLNLKIGFKKEELIMLLVITSTILINGFGIFMIFSLPRLDGVDTNTYSERLIPLSQLAVLGRLTEDTRVSMLTAVNLKDTTQLSKAESNMQEVNRQLSIYLNSYMTPKERIIYQRFSTYWQEYCLTVKQNMASIRSGDYSQAMEGIKKGEEPFNKASDELAQMIEVNQDIVNRFHTP